MDINKIYTGDCLELMKSLPDASVDAVICDLPYGTTKCLWDVPVDFGELWKQYRRIVRPKGNVVLFSSGRFTFALYASCPELFRYDLVWKKSKSGSAFAAKWRPVNKHENILVFGEPASYYDPQMVAGEPYRRKWTSVRKNEHRLGIHGVEVVNPGTRHPVSVLDFPQKWRRQDQLHPAQKPVELMEWLVRSYCPPGGLVLDNCCGSGTTCVAAIRTGRNWIGMESNPDYARIAEERCAAEMSAGNV
jgi:site-specific DNA-methyltransferase (adenine-specific)